MRITASISSVKQPSRVPTPLAIWRAWALYTRAGPLVSRLDAPLDLPGVVGAQQGGHAPLAPQLFQHLRLGVFAGVAQVHHIEGVGASRAVGGEGAGVIGYRVDDSAVAVGTDTDAAPQMGHHQIHVLIGQPPALGVLVGGGPGVEHMAEAGGRLDPLKPVIRASGSSSSLVTAS